MVSLCYLITTDIKSILILHYSKCAGVNDFYVYVYSVHSEEYLIPENFLRSDCDIDHPF